mmetsp:Transcript_5985/g.19385  ORF Transcript_5985/g.19385 Transcript_5985/m.19385 type:complete len:275 (-) Transcript_5985:476-1300(-)
MDRRGGRSGRHDLLPPRGHHRAHHAGARLPPHQALQVPARQPVPRHERHRRRAQHRDGQDAQRHVHQPLRALRQDRPGAAPLAAHGRHLPRPRPRHLLHRARVRGPPPLRRRARALELHLESNVDGAGDCPRRGRARGDAGARPLSPTKALSPCPISPLLPSPPHLPAFAPPPLLHPSASIASPASASPLLSPVRTLSAPLLARTHVRTHVRPCLAPRRSPRRTSAAPQPSSPCSSAPSSSTRRRPSSSRSSTSTRTRRGSSTPSTPTTPTPGW